jgi:peptide/nickel transport system substrate-binding protein
MGSWNIKYNNLIKIHLILVKILIFAIAIFKFSPPFKSDKTCTQAIDYLPETFVQGKFHRAYDLQIISQIYETLIRLSDDNKSLLPHLAKNWYLSQNKHEIYFTLYDSIFFHDGSKLNASSVKNCINWYKQNVKDSFYLNNIDNVEVIDSLFFKIHLKRKDARFLYYLASKKGLLIISTDAKHSNGKEIIRNSFGTGPFYLYKWHKNELVLRRFKRYRNFQGNISHLKFRKFPYSKKLIKTFRKDSVDVIYTVSSYDIDRLKWAGNIEYIIKPSINCNFLGFNCENAELNQKSIRKEILSFIDTNKIVNQLNRSTTVLATNPIPPVFDGFNSIKQADYLHIRMNQTETDYKNKLRLLYPEYSYLRPVFLETIKSELSKRGIELEIQKPANFDEFINARASDSTQLFISGWYCDILGDAGNMLWSLFYSHNSNNMFNYRNNKVNNLLDKSIKEFDYEKRNAYYRQVVKQVLEDSPALFISHLKEYYAYKSKKIKYISIDPFGIINYKDVKIEENY